jgi:hypothetical protein
MGCPYKARFRHNVQLWDASHDKVDFVSCFSSCTMLSFMNKVSMKIFSRAYDYSKGWRHLNFYLWRQSIDIKIQNIITIFSWIITIYNGKKLTTHIIYQLSIGATTPPRNRISICYFEGVCVRCTSHDLYSEMNEWKTNNK